MLFIEFEDADEDDEEGDEEEEEYAEDGGGKDEEDDGVADNPPNRLDPPLFETDADPNPAELLKSFPSTAV